MTYNGASVIDLAESNSSELVDQLNAAARISPLNFAAWLRGKRTVAVFYDVGDDHAARFQTFLETFEQLSRSHGAWHIRSSGALSTLQQRKTHAGAGQLVDRTQVVFLHEPPKALATNIVVPGVAMGTRAFHFLPDQLLVREHKTYAGIPYRELKVTCQPTRFIESSGVPADSVQVDSTWKYVNKSGGPDKRFKDNRQLPIMAYAEITLATAEGLHTVLQISNVAAAEEFARDLQYLAL